MRFSLREKTQPRPTHPQYLAPQVRIDSAEEVELIRSITDSLAEGITLETEFEWVLRGGGGGSDDLEE